MTVGISPDAAAGWLRQPIVRGLLLSAGLHFAFIFLFQTNPDSDTRHTVVINARLQAVPRSPLVSEEIGEERASPAEVQSRPLPGVLTATTPSAVPPIPQPAMPEGAPVLPPERSLSPNLPPAAPGEGEPPARPEESRQRQTDLPSLPIDIDTNWYLARQVDVQPKIIGKIQQGYPEEARRANIEGSLKLMLKIDDLGRVQSVEVVEAMPPGVFDAAAVAAFASARFQPALKDGRPVRYQAYMRVDFKLTD